MAFCALKNHLNPFDALFGNVVCSKSSKNNFMWNSVESLFEIPVHLVLLLVLFSG